jgi:hypothetical protein
MFAGPEGRNLMLGTGRGEWTCAEPQRRGCHIQLGGACIYDMVASIGRFEHGGQPRACRSRL